MNPDTWLTYDDVLLLPNYSRIQHRDEINLNVKLGDLEFGHPVIPANMKTIGTPQMYKSIANTKPLFILHRFGKELESYIKCKETFSSVGALEQSKSLIDILYTYGQRKFCIDLAHGHTKTMLETIDYIKVYGATVIAGNVCTAWAAKELIDAGADAIKVGVGPGSICTTRLMTGNGAPQLSALEEIRSAIGDNVPIIADGGIKNSGDMVKALCFADFVMCGNLFAGTLEDQGEIINTREGIFKSYDGSSTLKDRYVEGIKLQVPFKNKSASIVLNELLDGIRSGLSYQGCNKLSEFRKDQPWQRFVRLTNGGMRESYARG